VLNKEKKIDTNLASVVIKLIDEELQTKRCKTSSLKTINKILKSKVKEIYFLCGL